MSRYEITVEYDQDTENPLDDEGLFKLHMFSPRLVNYTDPDVLLACEYEFPDGHEYEGFPCDEMPTAAIHDTDHDHIGAPRGFFVSYFEHGQCRYGLAGTMSGMPDFRWDGVEYAGFLEVVGDTVNDWNISDEDLPKIAEATLEVYTDWANGECYWVNIEGYTEVKCDMGEVHRVDHFNESCGGFIGTDHLLDGILDMLPDAATEDNTKFIGLAVYGLEFSDLEAQKAKWGKAYA